MAKLFGLVWRHQRAGDDDESRVDGRADESAAERNRDAMSLREAVLAVRALVRPYPREVRLALVFAVIGSGASMAVPLVVARLFDAIAGSRRLDVVIACLAGWLALALVSAAAIRWRERAVAEVAARVGRDLRIKLADVELRAVGDCESLEVTAISGVEGVTTTIARILPYMVSGLAAVLVAVAAAMVLDWRVGLVVVVAVGPVAWLCARVVKRSQDARGAYTTAIKRLAAEARGFFHPAGRELAAVLRARPQVMARTSDIAADLCDADRARLSVITWPATQILGALLGIAVVGVAYLLGGVSLGAQVAFITLTRQQLTEILTLVLWFQELADQVPHIQTVKEALQVPTERQGGERLQAPAGRIEIRDAVADYPDGRRGVGGLSLSIAPGEAIALVGHSGAGKTTITRLLTGSEELTLRSGAVLLDDVPIQRLDLDLVRQLVVRIPQSSLTFDGIVSENLLPPTGATSEAIRGACQLALLDHEIRSWPNGYQTRIGGQTLAVAGGQAQRLGLARALLRVPGARVMLLDEATAALDPAAADQLLEGVLTYLRGVGIAAVVITHKLPVHSALTRVVVIEDGRAVEDGDPQRLAANPRTAYAQLLATRDRNPDLRTQRQKSHARPQHPAGLAWRRRRPSGHTCVAHVATSAGAGVSADPC